MTVAAALHAADGIGVVLRLGEEFRRGTRRTARIQDIDSRAARGRIGERIGVDGNEHVRPARPCLGNPHIERDEHVFVARHINGVTQRFEAPFGFTRNRQHHMFFAQTARTDCTGVFAAVSGVQHHNRTAAAAAGRRF